MFLDLLLRHGLFRAKKNEFVEFKQPISASRYPSLDIGTQFPPPISWCAGKHGSYYLQHIFEPRQDYQELAFDKSCIGGSLCLCNNLFEKDCSALPT